LINHKYLTVYEMIGKGKVLALDEEMSACWQAGLPGGGLFYWKKYG
jgi:hypothetical protein